MAKKKGKKSSLPKGVTKKKLVAAAKDMNEVMGLDPEIDVEQDPEGLLKDIKEEAGEVVAEDALEESTWELFEALGIGPDRDEDDDDDDDDDSEEDDDDDSEDDDEDDEDEDEEEDEDDDEDDDDDSSDDDDDDDEDEEEDEDDDEDDEPEPEPEPKKKGKGKKGKGKSKPKEEKSSKSTGKKAAPKKAGAPGRPGIIKTIRNLIQEKGPITKEQILDELVKAFPDREEKSMKNTIGIQVPNRINREADFDVEETDKGWVVVGKGKGKSKPKKEKATKKKDKSEDEPKAKKGKGKSKDKKAGKKKGKGKKKK